ncbi:hypothetical protein FIBSPDRAFT_729310, partial [Athelia psychrophila]
PGMLGLRVVHIKLLMSITYPCTLVEWFRRIERKPYPNTVTMCIQSSYQMGLTVVSVD